MKGLAATTGYIILIMIFVTYFGVYMYMTNNQLQSNVRLNLESLQQLKLKSTFGLFNTSLGTTYFISTVQAVFQTTDEGIGCGLAESGETVTTSEGFWMQTKTDRGRDTDETRENDQLVERIPAARKYNGIGRNPQICYPQEQHIVAWLNKKFAEGGYLNLKSNPIDADGVSITLPRKGDGTVDSAVQLKLEDNLIESRFVQDITATFGRGSITKKMENQNIVYTSLKRMVAAGRDTVKGMLLFGDDFYKAFNPNLHYTPTTSSKEAYLTQLSNIIENKIKQESRLPAGILPDVHVETALLAPTDATFIMQKYMGLMLYYKATVRYIEGTRESISASIPTFQWPTDSRDMNSCFGLRRLLGDDRARFHEAIDIRPLDATIDEPIRAAGDGIVIDVHNGCSSTGSLEPGAYCRNFGNNKGYGNFVLLKHDGFYTFYAHLKKDSIAVAPGQSVSAGQQIAVMGSSGRSTGPHLHFEVRTDSGKLDPCNYIDCTQSAGKICRPTGTATETISGKYYYHDEETNTFKKRPITLEYVMEDYLEALRCSDWPQSPTMFTWKTNNDMACCAGRLFFCNAANELVPGMAAEQVVQLNSRTSSGTPPQDTCNRVAGGLECTPSGFRTT